ncbi:MAG: Rid family detoxifying hydrolase [Microgenomates group bacterium]
MREIKTDKAQSAVGLLSQAIEVNGLIFTARFIHVKPDGSMVNGPTEDKLKQIMTNINEVLKAGGSSLNDIVKATIYVTDMSILGDFNKLYATYFSAPLPAREAVCVKELPLGASIEVSVIARKQ